MVGSTFAQRVLLKDTLTSALDMSSIQVIGASHPYQMSLSENGILSFLFDHIYLPDSISNEPESHGFVQFKILPHPNTPLGTLIKNRAWYPI